MIHVARNKAAPYFILLACGSISSATAATSAHFISPQCVYNRLEEARSRPTRSESEWPEALEPASHRSVLTEDPQLRLWQLQEEGAHKAAEELQQKLEQTLKHSPIINDTPVEIGSSGAHWVEFENGVHGVWKPSSGLGASEAMETAAYRIDQKLHLNLIPMITGDRYLNGVRGTVQLRIMDLHPKPLRKSKPLALSMIDYLLKNGDRNSRNSLLTSTGRIVAIDHGTIFHTVRDNRLPEAIMKIVDDFERAKEAGRMEQDRYLAIREIQQFGLDQKAIGRLRRITLEDWRATLGDILSENSITTLFERSQQLIQAVDEAEHQLGSEIYRGGPYSPIDVWDDPLQHR